MAKPLLGPGKKRVSISVNAENWDRIQALGRQAGLSRTWLSNSIDALLPALLGTIEKIRAEQIMTQKEAMHDLVERLLPDPCIRD